jgi:hypothetical protein
MEAYFSETSDYIPEDRSFFLTTDRCENLRCYAVFRLLVSGAPAASSFRVFEETTASMLRESEDGGS